MYKIDTHGLLHTASRYYQGAAEHLANGSTYHAREAAVHAAKLAYLVFYVSRDAVTKDFATGCENAAHELLDRICDED